jgi:hypothetical protein
MYPAPPVVAIREPGIVYPLNASQSRHLPFTASATTTPRSPYDLDTGAD